MPIYDYVCKRCGRTFETLVRKGETPACASCGGVELERLFPLPYVQSEVTKDKAMRAAKKRDQAQGTERAEEQIRYEKSHDSG